MRYVVRLQRSFRLQLRLWGCRRKVEYCGVLMCQPECSGNRDAEFIEATREAFDFLRDNDPRRFQCVKQSIRFVFNLPLDGYCDVTHSVFFDFERYHATLAADADAGLMLYAGTLSSAATWIRARSRTRGRDRQARERIHALGLRELERFAQRHRPDLAAHIDWDAWQAKWIDEHRWQSAGLFFARLRRRYRDLRKSLDGDGPCHGPARPRSRGAGRHHQ